MDPLTIGLLGGGALLGFLNSKKNNAEAQRREGYNRDMEELDTRFSPFNHGKSATLAPMEQKSVLGGALGGAMSGGMQGVNIANAVSNSNAYKSLLDRLKSSQITAAPSEDL